MAKRSPSKATDKPVEKTTEEPKRKESDPVKLRLKQNDYVYGKFAKEGKVFEFPRPEAEKRLLTEDKWEATS